MDTDGNPKDSRGDTALSQNSDVSRSKVSENSVDTQINKGKRRGVFYHPPPSSKKIRVTLKIIMEGSAAGLSALPSELHFVDKVNKRLCVWLIKALGINSSAMEPKRVELQPVPLGVANLSIHPDIRKDSDKKLLKVLLF